jgi:tetratricopeptide (TPR) repeat protein
MGIEFKKKSFGIFFLLLLTLLQTCLPAAQFEKKHICLVMITKNDEKVIERCLESAASIVDSVSIADTGSTDGTLEKINGFSSAHGIPVNVKHIGENSLSKNRTLSVKIAQDFLTELGLSLEDCYLLILDPDMVVKANNSFNKKTLKADSYLILEKSSLFSYYIYHPHLLRASLAWKNLGDVHHYWSCKEERESAKLMNVRIEEEIDDEGKDVKLKSALAILLDAIKEDPKNLHYQFQLAQTFKALKQFEQAKQWYSSRILLEGNSEEAWLSKYMLGECYQQTNQWSQALYWYLEAFQSNPKRADSLYKIANYYRLHGENELAYIFAKYGVNIPYPIDQSLFPFPPLKIYEFDEELSIAAYYTRFRKDGYTAINDLILAKEEIPWHVKEQAYRNILFYVEKLPAHFKRIEIELPFIEGSTDERYHPMNPSIQKTKNGYEVICRAVNYTQIGAKIFNTVDTTGIFHTKNFLLNYDKDFRLLKQHEIIENLPRKKIPAFNIDGLEDCRIFEFKDRFWFTCTTCDTNPTGDRQISLCRLEKKPTGANIYVEALTPLIGTDLSRCEKNWLPFVENDQLLMVYSYDPFVIYRPNLETGECETVVHIETDHDFSRFRGSAAPIPFDEGYLILVHEVSTLPEYYRCYLHRFLYLDKNFKIARQTIPFVFMHQGVEYCCSMTLDHSGKQLILPIGIEDREAHFCFVDVDTIRSLLLPLPPHVEHPFSR